MPFKNGGRGGGEMVEKLHLTCILSSSGQNIKNPTNDQSGGWGAVTNKKLTCYLNATSKFLAKVIELAEYILHNEAIFKLPHTILMQKYNAERICIIWIKSDFCSFFKLELRKRIFDFFLIWSFKIIYIHKWENVVKFS